MRKTAVFLENVTSISMCTIAGVKKYNTILKSLKTKQNKTKKNKKKKKKKKQQKQQQQQKKNTPTSSIRGVTSPDQSLDTITRMHIQTLYSLFRCSSYVSYNKNLVDDTS